MNASTGSNGSILELAAARERRTRWRSLLLTLIPAFFAVLLLWQAANLAQNMAGELLRKQVELVEVKAQLGSAREELRLTQQALAAAQTNIEAGQQTLMALQQQVEASQQRLAKLQANYDDLQQDFETLQDAYRRIAPLPRP